MKQFLFSILAVGMASVSMAQTTWKVDNSHSNVTFTVTHLVISEVEGSFKVFSGSIQSSKSDFSDAVINFSVDVNSVNTDNEKRDGHLKGDDFFNAEKYPQMTFKSTSFKKVSGNQYALEGDLTIRDITKKVKFDVTYGGTASAWGTNKAGFKAKTIINRFDYNLKWDRMTEAGGAVVGKDVEVALKLQFDQQKS